MAIELRLLRYFAVVAEALHVGNAAARLFISQPEASVPPDRARPPVS